MVIIGLFVDREFVLIIGSERFGKVWIVICDFKVSSVMVSNLLYL